MDLIEIKLASGWSVRLPSTFQPAQAEHGAVKATDGFRTVHLSSMESVAGENRPSGEVLHGASPAKTEAKYELNERGHYGFARVAQENDAYSLFGTREAEGSVCVVVATFTTPHDEPGAVAIWKSIREPARSE